MPSLLKQVRPLFFLPAACLLPDNRSSFDSHTLATTFFHPDGPLFSGSITPSGIRRRSRYLPQPRFRASRNI
ncbi:MAG: hypothetical protein EGQ81_06270 [Akkermansia sp.]|nr:hypothetical protein [Akkermansia sp.]